MNVPPLATRLEVGESVTVINEGDRIVVGGLVRPHATSPFRGSAGLVPGTQGLTLARSENGATDFASIALTMWRPCIAYLVVTLIILVPPILAAIVGTF
jgi:hypothetical protein